MLNSIKSISPREARDVHKNILDIYEQAAKKHPKYFTAFDFVSFEDHDHLCVFNEIVVEHFKDKEFKHKVSYHAGESYSRKNKNCLNAIQNGSQRLGHGLNILRDPKAIELAKEKGVTIEACPLSNNLLGYVNDLNWHPVKFLKDMGIKIT
jgi:adenosine deaminase CECR1